MKLTQKSKLRVGVLQLVPTNKKENCRSIDKMKNSTGEGVITRYEILPGMELFYNDFHMSDGQNQNKLPHPDVLEINHCREGRFECEFSNGDCQYVGAGDLAINRLTNETAATYFPLSHYHGISITIDLYQVNNTLKQIENVIGDLNIDIFIWRINFAKMILALSYEAKVKLNILAEIRFKLVDKLTKLSSMATI